MHPLTGHLLDTLTLQIDGLPNGANYKQTIFVTGIVCKHALHLLATFVGFKWASITVMHSLALQTPVKPKELQ